MSNVRLRAVIGSTGATAAIKNGSVSLRGYGLDIEEVSFLPEAFRRMVRGLEWDVCEMAFATYLCARAHGVRFTALPVFPVRRLHHGAIVRHRGTPLSTPRDLEGRRVGVGRGWTVTSGVWARGILAEEHGVDLDAIEWVLSGDEHVRSYVPPPNVRQLAEGDDLARFVAAGTVAAAVNVNIDHPEVVPLLPDAEEAAYNALASRKLYPINHVIVVRDEVLTEHPDVAPQLFSAFAEAKTRYRIHLQADDFHHPTPEDRMYRRVEVISGGDPLPYGVAPNRHMIDKLVDYAVSQHVVEERPDTSKIFAAGTLDLSG